MSETAAIILASILGALAVALFAGATVGASVAPSEIARANRELGACEAVRYDCEATLEDARASVEACEERLLPGVRAPGFPQSARVERVKP